MTALRSGTRLGPYEIASPLGAGGMGEVYRARDTRLGREVAIKVLPAAVAGNADALARFEREARAVAALSHPNILTLHDFGTNDGVTYAVLELLDGETLRARLAAGALPERKAVDVAAQIARGLSAAHDKHIVHRDLKPENVVITSDGAVKILDFGLARHAGPASLNITPPDSTTVPLRGALGTALEGAPGAAPDAAPRTEPGVVLGTVGYMAPEQVRGEASDHRTDIFALGAVLYEMLTGRRAYQRETAAEVMTAILKEEPPDVSASGVQVAPGVQRIVRRCLEKRPDERFQSTRDLAFALESALDRSSPSGAAAASPAGSLGAASDAATVAPSARRGRWAAALLAIGLALGATAGWFGAHRWRPTGTPTSVPSFQQITFERGTIRDARFTPDGQSILYGAAWEGDPLRIFMTRPDTPESVRLSLPDARLLSIARTGEMAISLGHTYEGWLGQGTLARSSVLGSAPRVIAEHIREAEWTPDGSAMAIVRRVGTLEQLELPLGTVLYRTSGFITDIRFSPGGDRIAFGDHPIAEDDAGMVSVVTRVGQRTVLSGNYTSVRGVAWSADGREVWFSGRKGGAEAGDGVYAVTLSGVTRRVWSSPSSVKLYDIAPDGRVLLGNEALERRVEALVAGAAAPVDVSLRAASTSTWISDDGTTVTLADQATPKYSAYMLKADGAPKAKGAAVSLGDGQPYGMSRDGRWIAALPVDGAPVLLHPTGAGQARVLPNPEQLVFDVLAWLPDSKQVVMFGQPHGQPSRGYVQPIDGGGPPRPFTREDAGVDSVRWWALPVSPDGTRVVGRNAEGLPTIYRIGDGAREAIPGISANEVPVQWTEDGNSLLVARGNGLPWIIEQVDLATGRRRRALEIRARDAAGLRLSILAVSRNGRHYVHSYSRLLTDLFVVNGLR